MSELYVSVERRYKFYAGNFYVQGIEDVTFFERYLDVFSRVFVVARVSKVYEQPEGHKLFNHEKITIKPIFTTGTGIANIITILKINRTIKKNKAKIILRTPGVLSYLLSLCFILTNTKFSLEVVTNPLQEANNLTNNKLLKYLIVNVFQTIFRMQISKCKYASFVTKYEIQQQFLTLSERQSLKYNSCYSSILLADDDIISDEKFTYRISRFKQEKEFHMLFIGVLDKPFKGLDVFLKIIAALPDNYFATVIGDGHLLNSYKNLARELNVYDRVKFEGYISDNYKKNDIMSNSDLFILTSRREGLPRVIIEAMANGLPCISTNVSGVAELINRDCIFPVDDWQAGVNKILSIDAEKMITLSKENLINSLQYKNSILKERRTEFYKKVLCGENFTFK